MKLKLSIILIITSILIDAQDVVYDLYFLNPKIKFQSKSKNNDTVFYRYSLERADPYNPIYSLSINDRGELILGIRGVVGNTCCSLFLDYISFKQGKSDLIKKKLTNNLITHDVFLNTDFKKLIDIVLKANNLYVVEEKNDSMYVRRKVLYNSLPSL